MLAKAAACLSVVVKALEVGEKLASCKEAFLEKLTAWAYPDYGG